MVSFRILRLWTKPMTIRILLFSLLLLVGQAVNAYEPSKIYGPYYAEVVRTIDGDTIVVRARIFPHFEANLSVRIAGIDTPEIRGKCEEEKQLAQDAKAWVENRFPPGTWVLLENVEDDKYSGRVVADVYLSPDMSLGQMLLDDGQAVEYYGTGPKKNWCE